MTFVVLSVSNAYLARALQSLRLNDRSPDHQCVADPLPAYKRVLHGARSRIAAIYGAINLPD